MGSMILFVDFKVGESSEAEGEDDREDRLLDIRLDLYLKPSYLWSVVFWLSVS